MAEGKGGGKMRITKDYLKRELERLEQRREESVLQQEQISLDGSILTIRKLLEVSKEEK